MAETWVVNASPLIALAGIGRLDLLTALGADLIIPDGVATEIGQGPPDDPALQWLRGHGRTCLGPAGNVDPRIAAWDLGLGESHVLTRCLGRDATRAVLDDRAARRCAQALGIPCLGTLAVIALAQKAGIVPAAGPLYAALQKAGFRVGREVLRAVLDMLDETTVSENLLENRPF